MKEAQRLAEGKYPRVGKPDGSNDSIAILQDASRIGFIEGFTADRWIEVTPDTMPDDGTECLLKPRHMEGYDTGVYRNQPIDDEDEYTDGCFEMNGHLTGIYNFTHYQIIEKPKL